MLMNDDRIGPSQLRWFGLSLASLMGCVALWLHWRYSQTTAAAALATLGGVLLVVYYATPQSQTTIIRGFRWLTWPIQWVVSIVLLGMLFYGVIAPIGLLMRMLGKDPLVKRPVPGATSYWSKYPQASNTRSYFRLY